MHPELAKYFLEYPPIIAPFMHEQLGLWESTRPLKGLKVVNHVPVVSNTVLKIGCLLAAGAEVTVTNPSSFMSADKDVVSSLGLAGVRYADDINSLRGEHFDLYFDCGAELYQALGKPNIGAIELTGSGDQFYRCQSLDFPVISIDPTLTKQLETVFGCAESINLAIAQEKKINPAEQAWLIFGFGKIGRGLAYFCVQNNASVAVVDLDANQREAAYDLGIHAIDPTHIMALKEAVLSADIIVTATGKKSILNDYPLEWFSGKILANMGIYDEYGEQFRAEDVLNKKQPVNFILKDPTPMKYIDPEFYIHNYASLMLLQNKMTDGVHGVPLELDRHIIQRWCEFHSFPLKTISKWFITDNQCVEK
ncbi:NAD-binding protein [Legionella bononiensis]|uniref:NAD-binding protein n=1 Tax=Legionella bononiensis TaxID=2793102 RepID=A0ABS1WGA8_9GAMM|nr:NAD-binding protein [Legionella bononiensis]MBL7481837.1 NAD-binding protein [Legionella bononiensis]MBL7528386.1 NAD-binding protein [Legionella bononiensis]MBL7564349.1 NAD-binding protein [Legionella bononiensis]